MTKFLFTTDLHYGYERRNGHKIPLHDLTAWNSVLSFAKDFKPNVWILGGDMLDCGVVSHHNHGKPGQTEGLKLINDATEMRKLVIEPVQGLCKTPIYMIGNHEDWLADLTTMIPSLEGLLDVKALLALNNKWQVIPQGTAYNLGKLTFLHGDTIKGGEHVGKNAVINYERNVRFGHHHTWQVYTKNSAMDYKNAKTGIAVPCLCTKAPKYGEGAPNRWVQGFNYGYYDATGFSDYVTIILDGRCVINGKTYSG